MKIIHQLDDLTYQIFPEAKGDIEKLKELLKDYYTYSHFEPKVEVKNDFIEITIDIDSINKDEKKFQKLIELSEKSKFDKAKKIAHQLVEDYPTVSEYNRILGQIYSETGDQNKAIDYLIDSLKWNPKNESALIMVGNIYAKHKSDIETALKYYEKVLEVNPNDYLALNNIGAQLYKAEEKDKARDFFERAFKANPDYPNTLYALGMIQSDNGNNKRAFEFGVESIKKNPKKDSLYNQGVKFTYQIAKELINDIDAKPIVQKFIDDLEEKTGTEIKLKPDSSINTTAKIEYSEIHGRDYHLVLYKPDHPAIEHLLVHELTHLELAQEAREKGEQKIFTSNESTKSIFMLNFKDDIIRLKKNGMPESQVNKFMESLYNGLNSQIFNSPIDLFIEDRIYNRFEDLRPLQFISLYSILKHGIDANTRPDIIRITPSKVLSSSVIYNLVNALQFQNLYGINFIDEFNPKTSEIIKAKKFFNEFLDYRKSKEAGAEYDLVQYWAEDLDLHRYFEILPEDKRKQKTSETILDEIESDPYGLDYSDPSKDRKMKQFLEEHGSDDINMAVSMYMVDALQYFNKLPKSDIKKIAFEIAHIGMSGIDPKKDGYKIPSIPNSNFSGYKTLAYYYVSWALAVPEMLSKLQMPFEEEYKLANQLMDI